MNENAFQMSKSDSELDKLNLRIKRDLKEFNAFCADLEACRYLEKMAEYKKQVM